MQVKRILLMMGIVFVMTGCQKNEADKEEKTVDEKCESKSESTGRMAKKNENKSVAGDTKEKEAQNTTKMTESEKEQSTTKETTQTETTQAETTKEEITKAETTKTETTKEETTQAKTQKVTETTVLAEETQVTEEITTLLPGQYVVENVESEIPHTVLDIIYSEWTEYDSGVRERQVITQYKHRLSNGTKVKYHEVTTQEIDDTYMKDVLLEGERLSKLYGDYAAEIIKCVNEVRIEHGLEPVETDEKLLVASFARACENAYKKELTHTRPNGGSYTTLIYAIYNKNNLNCTCTEFGENIMMAAYLDVSDAVEVWMESEGHRDIILNPGYKKVGAGYAKGNGPAERYFNLLFTN